MTFFDFFSGIGGFRLGMEQAGHECVGHCEIDKYANISYAAIHEPKESEYFATDIRNVEPGDLPDCDCYCGGFPCQSFSIAGKRGGFDDTRGTLFFEVMRLAAVRKPRLLFLENVAGLLNHDNGRTFETIIRTMDELGYDAEWQVLNSKHFGVPQNRERVFIIGHLRGIGFREVFPIRQGDGAIAELSGQQNIANCVKARYEAGAVGAYVVEREQYAQALTERRTGIMVAGTIGDYRMRSVVLDPEGILTCLDTMRGGGHEPKVIVQPVLTPDRPEKRQNGRRFKEDGEEMFTLTAQDRHGVMIIDPQGRKNKECKPSNTCPTLRAQTHGNEPCIIFDDTQGFDGQRQYTETAPTLRSQRHGLKTLQNARIRRLTPLECGRLQGYPDWVHERIKAAGVSDSQEYKQYGNSVTVNVIYEIAKRL